MPAAESKRHQVIDAIVAALRAISGAEYHYPLQSAKQVSDDPTTQLLTVNAYDLPKYVVETTPEGTRDFYPGSHMVEFMNLNVQGRYDVKDGDPTARATALENMAHDIEKALTVDVTLGGLVYDTRVMVPRGFVGLGSEIVILVQPVTVRIHRTYGEP